MKLNKRAVALLVSLVVLLTVAVGVTIAFVADKTPEVENTFKPSKVTCAVTEVTQNQVYSVSNTGDTTAYIRVAVVVNWVNTEGHVYAKAPTYTVKPENTNWILGTDGYYYYINPVAAGMVIAENLTVTLVPESATAPEGHTLQVEVIASAIQATVTAVNQWSGGVATATTDGGRLTVSEISQSQ